MISSGSRGPEGPFFHDCSHVRFSVGCEALPTQSIHESRPEETSPRCWKKSSMAALPMSWNAIIRMSMEAVRC